MASSSPLLYRVAEGERDIDIASIIAPDYVELVGERPETYFCGATPEVALLPS